MRIPTRMLKTDLLLRMETSASGPSMIAAAACRGSPCQVVRCNPGRLNRVQQHLRENMSRCVTCRRPSNLNRKLHDGDEGFKPAGVGTYYAVVEIDGSG
jgi:hypothetical protein